MSGKPLLLLLLSYQKKGRSRKRGAGLQEKKKLEGLDCLQIGFDLFEFLFTNAFYLGQLLNRTELAMLIPETDYGGSSFRSDTWQGDKYRLVGGIDIDLFREFGVNFRLP